MIYTIQNEKVVATIDSKGAELKSLKKREDAYEYIWQGNPAYWKRSSPTLFPYIGAVKNDGYTLNGEFYPMSRHGFVRDVMFEMVEISKDHVKFLYISNEKTLEMYPYDFKLWIVYTIREYEIIMQYKIENLTKKEMYFNIGGHTAYNFKIEEGEKYLVFEKHETRESSTFNLETGLTCEETIEVLDNQKELLITYDLFKHDTLLFEGLKSKYVILDDRKSNRKIKIDFSDFPYLAIWTPNAPFICIEPWYGITDYELSENAIERKKGIYKLEAHASIKLNTSIEIL